MSKNLRVCIIRCGFKVNLNKVHFRCLTRFHLSKPKLTLPLANKRKLRQKKFARNSTPSINHLFSNKEREESLTCAYRMKLFVYLKWFIYLELIWCCVRFFSDLFLSGERMNKQSEKRSQNKLIDLLICFHV